MSSHQAQKIQSYEMQKGPQILKIRVFSISNEVHYGVDDFICYRGEQHILVVLTVQ